MEKSINLTPVKILILEADNGKCKASEIRADFPHDNDWQSIGGDYWFDGISKFAGPSGGNPERTCVDLDAISMIGCPLCNGTFDFYSFNQNSCQCELDDVKREIYGY